MWYNHFNKIIVNKHNGNKKDMQNNSEMTRTTIPGLQTHVRVHLTNVLIGNGSLEWTIYWFIWDIIFTCSTYYRVMLFVCLCISHYRVRFIQCMFFFTLPICLLASIDYHLTCLLVFVLFYYLCVLCIGHFSFGPCLILWSIWKLLQIMAHLSSFNRTMQTFTYSMKVIYGSCPWYMWSFSEHDNS